MRTTGERASTPLSLPDLGSMPARRLANKPTLSVLPKMNFSLSSLCSLWLVILIYHTICPRFVNQFPLVPQIPPHLLYAILTKKSTNSSYIKQRHMN
jgi:hypothetical protein